MQVILFGNFQIRTDTHDEVALRPTAARLFAFLLLNRQRAHLREVVAESFWQQAELDRARRRLNTTLWQLRNALRQTDDGQANLIAATPEQIAINQEADLWLDVADFEQKAERGLAHARAGRSLAAVELLEEAAALYKGELLHGFYDQWVLEERERLRLIYLRCLTRLMQIHRQQRNLNVSIGYARRILHVEPWREDIHRTLMRLYVENGRRAKALQQYQVCRQVLESELAVTPAAETEALYRRLLTGSDGGHAQKAAALHENSANEPTLPEAIAQLQVAVQTMQAAQRSLEQAMALVARLKSGEIGD